MKIKTFNLTEEVAINEFLEGVRPIQGGITIENGTVTIQYFEGKKPEFDNEAKEAQINSNILDFTKKIFESKLELLFRESTNDSNSPSERIKIEKEIEGWEGYISKLEDLLKELA